MLLLGPIVAYLISLNVVPEKDKLKQDEEDYLTDVAYKTWKFFEDNLNFENHYLITDNIQLNRDIKEERRTSPTNIGMSLISIVSAHKLEFIDDKKAIELIKKIVTTIKKLDKWNGHLYNWYDTITLGILPPNYISSVDSGNFVASLIVVKQFLIELNMNQLAKEVESLIKNTKFKELFTERNVFSVGYNADEGRLENYNYNKFMSESRITTFVAIAKGEIEYKHWFSLDRTLVAYKKNKGIASWGGTTFEYFMPLLFLKSYPNTLLDESYYFTYFTHKDYMRQIDSKLPWGITESAYNDLDQGQNYKYRSFGIPYLKLKDENPSKIVVAPYGSVLALTEYPKEVIDNMKKYEDLEMLGEYGFYESYDVTDKIPVYAYYSHHQGMILGSIANCIKDGVIQNYFMTDTNNRVYDVLNKEKVQVKPVINFKMMKYKKYTYDKEQFVNDIRVFRHISTLPELSVLSNSKYSVVINDRGSGYSKYHTLRMNRYRKVTEQDYGMFLYIKDLENNSVWSNTYSPVNVLPKMYEVVFALDRIKYIRKDASIITTTEIVVAKKHNAEIRKVTFQNLSNKPKLLELTTYTEPLLCNNDDDIAHRSFSNMFVKSEYDNNTNSIIMSRKLRENNTRHYMISKLLINNPKDEFQYETNRANFIGRNRTGKNPIALEQKLTNYVDTPLDPIVSLRNTIEVGPNSKKTVYLINGFGKSREQVINIVNTFSDKQTINEQGFEVATIMSNVTNKMANITGNDMRLYNILLNYLLQTSNISITEKRKEVLEKNTLGPQSLWKFGVSGDRPVILLDVKDVDDLSLIKELLHAFEYYKSKAIFVDLVIINCDKLQDAKIVSREIEEEKYRMHALNSFHNTPGNIYTIERNSINDEELILFNTVARFVIDSSIFHTLQEYINELQRLNTVTHGEKMTPDKSLPVPYNKSELNFFNEYGGFKKDGKEYSIVNQNTPIAWTNVLANKNFGTIVTNNNCGFTYAINSREFKLTSWTNDNLLLDYSEVIKINDEIINFGVTNFGFGYTESIGRIKKLDVSLVQFVPVDDMKKIYKIKIKNNNSKKQRVVVKYWLNPILGVSEEKTGRHILSKFNEDDNYLMLKNKYNQGFNNITTYVTCTSKLNDADIDTILYKEVATSFYIDSNEEKEIAFILGCTNDDVLRSIKPHNNMDKINEELNNVVETWKKKLGVINVKTPDESFDYMVNGWYLYQTISSRLYARAGFNQVGGAFGFRDQLQDSMNICTVHPAITKAQILKNANHQFKEGDVLHWWHENINFGLRSLYKDDYLWLIYAVSEYIRITKDIKILDEQVGYVEGPTLKEGEHEKAFNFSYSSYTDTLYRHLELIVEKAMNDLGENGLPLMGGGDWNDGMNRVGVNGKGTSVWLGFFLYQMIENFVSFTKEYDSKKDISKYVEFNKKLKSSLLEVAWDGEHYLRAFFDNGNKLGSNENEECSIDLISQSMAILSDIATPSQVELMINSVEKELVDNKNQIVKLLTPAFEKNNDDPGYIMNYPKGIRENGGQYTHASAWYIMALLKIGQYDKAYKYYQMINPINRTKTKSGVLKYKGEPYVIAADIYSNKDYEGQGGWTWYTGSSAWFYRVGIIDILGFDKQGDKLYINPKVPESWQNFEISYKYLDTVYNIKVNLNQKKNSITSDDVLISDDYIKLFNDLKEHNVIINVGGKK